MPKVSIIIIFYNTEKFFTEAIQSVLSQTYEDWELLLVDDGSSDSSTAIAQKYVQQYPKKIYYLDHPGHENHGMSATRNLGLRHAQGEYIALLDADDVWLPHKLERQVKILDRNPEAAMVYGPTLYWYGWTGKSEDIGRDKTSTIGLFPNKVFEPPALMTHYLRYQGSVPWMCALMVRKNALIKVGGFEENFRGLYEDQVFYAKMALNYPIYVDENLSSKYRKHEDSACSQAEKSGYYNPYGPNKAVLVFIEWLSMYIIQKGFTDSSLKLALKKRMFPYEHPVLFRLVSKLNNFMDKLRF